MSINSQTIKNYSQFFMLLLIYLYPSSTPDLDN